MTLRLLTTKHQGVRVHKGTRQDVRDKMKALVEVNQYVVLYFPKNMTDQFQPMDLTVNDPENAFLKELFETWYAKSNGKVYQINVPLKLSTLKPIQARWIIGQYDFPQRGSLRWSWLTYLFNSFTGQV